MDVVYCDTETTSLREPHRPGGRRTWEVALIRVPESGAQIRTEWLQIVNVDLADADPFSLNVGRFFDRWSRREGLRFDQPIGQFGEREVRLEGVEEARAARRIEELTRGAVLAGSNPAFDAANFADILERHSLPVSWYHHHRDIPNIATGWLMGRGALLPYVGDEFLDHQLDADGDQWGAAPSYSTKTLSVACGVPEPADRHSAWADTLWMYEWDQVLRGTLPG